jgi:lambda repressor-like predicted transcriptional regulator
VRKKLIIATTAGALTLTGLAVAVPALADPDTTGNPGSSVVERITDALSGLVSDGSLTQEQADEVATTLSEGGMGGHGGHGRHGEGMDLAAAATALGLSEDDLRSALQTEGTTLAQVAEDEGVAVDTLIAALVQAQEERIAQAVEDGRLSQEEADDRPADLEERIIERVNSADGGRGHGDGHRGGRGDDAFSDGIPGDDAQETPAD